MNKKTASHIPYMAFFTVVIIIMALTSACQQKCKLSKREKDEYEHYYNAVAAAQDSSDYEKKQRVAKEFYDAAQKGHSDLFRAHAAANYAQVLIVTGKPDEGKEILDEVMKQSASFAEDTVMGDIYNGYGLYEMVKGRNQYAAIEYNLKALEYTRKCNDKSGLVSVLSNLGLAMSAARDTMGLRYALEAYQLAKETGSKDDMMYAALRMMEQMKLRGNISEARKWMDIFIKSAPPSQKALANEFRCHISMMEKDYAKANYYIDLAIAEADTSKNMQPISKIGFYYTKALGLFEEGKCKESLQWLDKSMNLAKELDDMSKEMESVMLYYRNYKKLGNYREAVEYLDNG